MKCFSALFAVQTLCLSAVRALDGYTVPPGSPGYQRGNSTQRIQFDPHSLFIDGKRIFIFSGEFHPWRLPVPELWADVLQKMKVSLHVCYLALAIWTNVSGSVVDRQRDSMLFRAMFIGG